MRAMRHLLVTVLCASGLVVVTGRAASVAVAPTWIESAIAYGQTSKDVSPIPLGDRRGLFDKLTGGGKDQGVVCFTTPYVRVALAALDAKQKFKTFTAANVPAWMYEPVINVYIPSYMGVNSSWLLSRGTTMTTTAPEHVVIRTHGDDVPEHAVQPLRVREYNEAHDWLAQVGATRGAAMVAELPLSALVAGREFYIIFRQDDQTYDFNGQHQNSGMKPLTFAITHDMVTLAGCPLACH